MVGLTARQALWLNAYLETWNATEAARMAGYAGDENTLAVTGHDNLRNPKIAQVVMARLSASAMTADEALGRLADQGRSTMADFLAEEEVDGEVRYLEKIDLNKAAGLGRLHLVKKLSVDDKGIKIELYDAQKALSLIAQTHGLLGARGTIDDPVHTIPLTLEEWRKRAGQNRAQAEERMMQFEGNDA